MAEAAAMNVVDSGDNLHPRLTSNLHLMLLELPSLLRPASLVLLSCQQQLLLESVQLTVQVVAVSSHDSNIEWLCLWGGTASVSPREDHGTLSAASEDRQQACRAATCPGGDSAPALVDSCGRTAALWRPACVCRKQWLPAEEEKVVSVRAWWLRTAAGGVVLPPTYSGSSSRRASGRGRTRLPMCGC